MASTMVFKFFLDKIDDEADEVAVDDELALCARGGECSYDEEEDDIAFALILLLLLIDTDEGIDEATHELDAVEHDDDGDTG